MAGTAKNQRSTGSKRKSSPKRGTGSTVRNKWVPREMGSMYSRGKSKAKSVADGAAAFAPPVKGSSRKPKSEGRSKPRAQRGRKRS